MVLWDKLTLTQADEKWNLGRVSFDSDWRDMILSGE